MFATLLMKEIRETVITGKFIIATVLCLILIPLGMYVTTQEYSQSINDYRQAVKLYQQRSEGKVYARFKAEGYRPPSPLSVFAVGLEPVLPNKAVTSESRYASQEPMAGVVKISNESGLHNPLAALFGKMDYLFNVGFVLSIFALLFTFSCITGEREMGTLKLISSNPVPQWNILLAKIIGNYLVFFLPFLVSFLAALLILNFSGIFSMNAAGVFHAILIIFGVTVLFLFCMFTFGVLLSVFSRHSMTAIVLMLVIWVVFALVIPKLSPMVAQIIKPVESAQILSSKIQNVREDLRNEQLDIGDKLFTGLIGRHGHTVEEYLHEQVITDDERKHIETEYDELVGPIREEYAGKILLATQQLQRNHDNALKEQETIAIQISRLSPICCFTYILTDLAGTGLMEIGNFTRQAERFQEQVKQTVYDKFFYHQYGAGRRYYIYLEDIKGATLGGKIPVPGMYDYHFLTVREAIFSRWVDILLLTLYTILFFAGAFVKFLRYDVR
jgi:ABC-type transport system involved in multi-copper enzyme maturation permease subunit